eukprot:g20649.t1
MLQELEAQAIPKVGAMFSQRRRDRDEEADGAATKPKKKRKRKTRYPKGFDPANPGPPPDPERWLPKRERSEFKKKMRKKDKHLLRGPQGAITTEDFRKQGPSTAQVEVSKDATGPSRRSRSDEDEEEAAEQKALERWRPEVAGHTTVTVKKRVQAQNSHEENDAEHYGEADNASAVSSEQEVVVEEEAEEDEQQEEAPWTSCGVLNGFGLRHRRSSKWKEAHRVALRVARSSMQKPRPDNEPAEIFSTGKSGKRNKRMEEAAFEDAKAIYRAKSKTAAAWLDEMGLEDCLLAELSQGIGEDADELRFALEQSKRFVVDDDHVVEKTLVQRVFDVMESDIETMTEVLNKLGDVSEAEVRAAVKDSLGEFKIRVANDIELLERVDVEAGRRKRYARRVYVDTAKRALVVQGANGPKFFPFAAMKEERMDDNYVCDIPDVISVADKSTKLDPVLAKRWASGNERLAAGQEVPEVGSRADFSRKDTELAKTFAKMQRQAKRGNGEAERCQLQFSAGQKLEHVAEWGPDGHAGRLHWSAVVLSDLTVDLEVRAVVRIPPDTEDSEPTTEEIVLHRNARGGTFVGSLDAASDRPMDLEQLSRV